MNKGLIITSVDEMLEKKKYIFIVIMLVMLVSCQDIDSSVANTLFGLTALKYEFIIVLLSMISGITMIIAGVVFLALGLNGNIEWIVEATDFHSRMINASPGLVLAIVGGLLVWRSRMNIKVTKENKKD